ncbi:MAG: MGH1-like glycoside hydrolase domain-containing protein, partial [Ardenticatenaceae bacterium]
DYSATGAAWEYFPHDHARSRAYRWNEDGLGGLCNRFQNICLAVALWNERDAILKERLFGLTGPEGNHGEDVKEYYFHLDGTPTHSYLKLLYKYPQVAFPYARLVSENRRRGRDAPEYELIDALTECFRENCYFDVFIEYAKAAEEDILCRVTAVNRGPEAAPLHVLPHLWYRNTWSWGHNPQRPEMHAVDASTVYTRHRHLGERWWYVLPAPGAQMELLFTENDSNAERLWGVPNGSPYVKDGIHEAVVNGYRERVNPEQKGSKVAAHCWAMLPPGEPFTVRVRFSPGPKAGPRAERRGTPLAEPFEGFDALFDQRVAEADDFYAVVQPASLTCDERLIQRQAFAGLMWSKQFYHYGIELWLRGDLAGPPPPGPRTTGRNSDWTHLY